MENKLKCIVCGEEAVYIYLGGSYCQRHRDEYKVYSTSVVKQAINSQVPREGGHGMYEGWRFAVEFRPTWGFKRWNKREVQLHFGWWRFILSCEKV